MKQTELPIVSKEVAEMLKQLGFDALVTKKYGLFSDNHVLINTRPLKNSELSLNHTSAPEQALAAMYLREEHGIDVQVIFYGGSWSLGVLDMKTTVLLGEVENIGGAAIPKIYDFKTYELALEAGLKKACEILLTDKK